MSLDILIYKGKYDDEIYDVSTPEKEAAAYLMLFGYLDEEWGVYSDIEEPTPLKVCEPCEKALHRLCEGTCACENSPECRKKSRRAKSDYDRDLSVKRMYDKAKAGDAEAAKRLLYARKGNEYEGFQLGYVIDPLEEEDGED